MGDKYTYVNMADVAYFEREEKYVCAVLFNGKKYITDFLNLSEVEAIVNPDDFCLISRSIIVNIQAIGSVYKWFNNRLKVTITCGDNTEEILVSSARRKIFLDWLGG
nr:LytTR family DNA-binding domain-containing protein [uncultured Prevotella sp.]